MLSKRQVLFRYGFNGKTFQALVEEGVLPVQCKYGKRNSIFVQQKDLFLLKRGEHYVVCQACGAFQMQITTKHLKMCSSQDLTEYKSRYPKASLICSWSARRKQKTEEQKNAQSLKLKKRFQTEAGDRTRQQISQASKAMHQGKYGDQASAHLRMITQTDAFREATSFRSRQRWVEGGDLRRKVPQWHRENRLASLRGINHARKSLKRTSNLHLRFKKSLEGAGLEGFVTEYPVRWYSLDEARPDLKLAVEVDGCYWHGCPSCGHKGVSRIRQIDKSKNTYLASRGWKLLRIRECEIKASLEACIVRVSKAVEERDNVEQL